MVLYIVFGNRGDLNKVNWEARVLFKIFFNLNWIAYQLILKTIHVFQYIIAINKEILN